MNEQLLGFGFMRLPALPDGNVDLKQTCAMADRFLENGFRWFDTARPYHNGNSERLLHDAVIARYKREDLLIADKMTLWLFKEGQTPEEYVQEQLAVTGAEYFDRYLLHAMDQKKVEDADRRGVWDHLCRMKEQGIARKIGLSFHDNAETLDRILTAHPEMDFVQLQINYIDWFSSSVQAEQCCKIAQKHKKPVIVMEPVKGGMLASLPPEAMEILGTPDRSAASWAIRYAASQPGVVTVLSGMSNMEQLEDNIRTLKDFTPLSAEETARLDQVRDWLNAIPVVPCTRCGYCANVCPQELPISNLIAVLNSYRQFGVSDGVKGSYRWYARNHTPAECLHCGLCSKECPQHIAIPDCMTELAEAAEKFNL